MRYRLKHIFEYAVLRSVVGLVTVVPYRVALGLGWVIAAISRLFLRKKMKRTATRIRSVLGSGPSDREIGRMVRRAWLQLCWVAIEGMRTSRMTVDWIRKMVDVRDVHVIADNMKDGRGVIVAVPHLGNWELAGVACTRLGVRLMTIARSQRNPLTDAYLERMREQAGLECYESRSAAFAGILRGLREGKSLAILPDLRGKGGAYRCRYLGAETDIPSGMARFAREAGVPIIPGFVYREGWGRYVLRACDPVWPDPSLDRDEDGRRMTQYVMDCLDRAVREHPEQYFWFNNRWVLGKETSGANPPSK